MILPLQQNPETRIPPLQEGERLSREEFERRYEAMPNLHKAELIQGVVYMPSPVRYDEHAKPNALLAGWLFVYESKSYKVHSGVGGTIRFGNEDEFQPDAFLFLDPSAGGQITKEDGYICGGPELVVEVSASTKHRDRTLKFDVYERFGVREYVLYRVEDQEIDWFVLRNGVFQKHLPDSENIFRSEVFPGLWLDGGALLREDSSCLLKVLDRGLASQEHLNFVQQLQAR